MSTVETPTRLLTLPDVARRLNVSRATVYRMVYDGRLPTLQLGGPGSPLRVDEAELERAFPRIPAERHGTPPVGQSSPPAHAGGEAA